ncbi:hypothetical protein BC828DRAFT_393505, partial [Blastocladiella britannica]
MDNSAGSGRPADRGRQGACRGSNVARGSHAAGGLHQRDPAGHQADPQRLRRFRSAKVSVRCQAAAGAGVRVVGIHCHSHASSTLVHHWRGVSSGNVEQGDRADCADICPAIRVLVPPGPRARPRPVVARDPARARAPHGRPGPRVRRRRFCAESGHRGPPHVGGAGRRAAGATRSRPRGRVRGNHAVHC